MRESVSASTSPRRVVIIGAGLAGLSAAESLARHGAGRWDITLLESKRRSGGRAGSFSDPGSGESVDYCQHVAMGCCTNLLGLMDRCGLADQWQRYRELTFYHPEFPLSRFAASRWLPPPLHLASALGGLQYLDASQKRALRRALWRLMRTDSQSLRKVTAASWMKDHEQSEQLKRRFWDVILVSALGENTEVVSMAAARKVLVDGFAAARDATDVWVPRLPLADLIGKRLAGSVETLGVKLQTGSTVRKISRDDNGKVQVLDSQHRTWVADDVISAVPWHVADDLLGGIAQLSWQSRSLTSSPITGVHLWFDREIIERPHLVMIDTMVQWLFRNPLTQTSNPGYYQAVISAAGRHGELTKPELIDRVLAELRRAFPDSAGAKLLRYRIVTDPHSVFSLSPEADQARPSSHTALPWLHLCGDWIQTGWPATMEGAVISGRMAASGALVRAGMPEVPIDRGLPRGWLANRLIRP